MFKKSKNLLLFLAFITSTVCLSQKDSIVCLHSRQVDYFILEHLSAQFLRIDTIKKGKEISILNKIISNNDFEISAINLKVENKAAEVIEVKKINLNLTEKNIKTEKKLRVFKNTTLIFGSISVILIGILLLKT